MKKSHLLTFVIGLTAVTLTAQENEIETLRKQLKEATDNFQKTVEEQRKLIDLLNKKIDALEIKTKEPAPIVAATNAPAPPSTLATSATPAWSPTNAIRLIGAGQNYINLSFDGLF